MSPLLTLVMIVRDEEAALPGFLAHHAGLCDEAIVVDTGSADRTASLARAAGATVVAFAWADDFAAARNAGLDAASGDRVLLLDADERIAAADFEAVRAAAAEPGCAWLMEARNYCRGRSHLEWRPVTGRYPLEEAGHEGYFASRRVGLFPREAGIRFRGRIHESVLAACEERGLGLRLLAAPVHHYGYVGPGAEAAARRRRATAERLAALKLADDPQDPAARLEYATLLLEAGRPTEAESHLERLASGPGALRPVARGRFLLGRLRREQGRTAEAAALLATCTRDDPGFLFGWLELARVHSAGGAWREVFSTLAAARRAVGADEPLLDREELLALARTGRIDEALTLAKRLVATCPRWPEIASLRDRLEKLAGGGAGGEAS